MSHGLNRWDLINSNDKLMLIGIFMFLIGGIFTTTGNISVKFGFLTALTGLLMYTGGVIALSKQINFMNSRLQKKI